MALQTEQTNLALNANTQATVMIANLNYLLSGLQYPELVPERSQERGEDDETRILVFTSALSRTREYLLSQRRAGLVDDAAWDAYPGVLAITGQLFSGVGEPGPEGH